MVRYFNSWIEVDNLDKEDYVEEKDVIFCKKNCCYFLHLQMEFCDYTLRDYIKLRNGINIHQLQSIYNQILNGIEYIHSNNIVHRDIKPENILITKTLTVKITDFGYGKVYNAIEDETTYTGSRLYSSPEQLEGRNVTFKTDIYSLGIVTFELVNVFFTEMERVLEIQKLREIPESTKSINIIKKMVSFFPDSRPTITEIRISVESWITCYEVLQLIIQTIMKE